MPADEQDGQKAEPLLSQVVVEPASLDHADPPSAPHEEGASSLPASIFNLTNTLVGAGIVALPRAVATLGLVLGAGLIVFVCLLTYCTMAVLVRASGRTDKWTFQDLVQHLLGPVGTALLHLSIILNNAGLLITYTIMLGDVLVGAAPEYNGVLTSMAGVAHSGAGPPWYLERKLVVGVVTLACLLPLVLKRNLSALAWAGAASTLLAALFGIGVGVLAGLAAAKHSFKRLQWWPNPDLTGPTLADQALGVLGTLPVVALAFVCHYQIHPLMKDMRHFTENRMLSVVIMSLSLVGVVYLIVGVGCFLIFQDDTQADVLLNFSRDSLAPLVGTALAQPLCYAIWLGYAFNLVFTYPMLNWSLRETIFQLWHQDGRPPSNQQWALVSIATVVVVYAVAMAVPDIWSIMSLTGATAAVAIGFIFPALLAPRIALSVRARRGALAGSALLCVLGGATALVAVIQTLSPLLA